LLLPDSLKLLGHAAWPLLVLLFACTAPHLDSGVDLLLVKVLSAYMLHT
jgi:hypothetical protein